MYLTTILEHTARFRHGGSAHFDVGGFSFPTSIVFPASASVLYILMICCGSGLNKICWGSGLNKKKMDIPRWLAWLVLFQGAAKFALALLVLVGTLVGAYERSLDAGLGGIAGLFCPPQTFGIGSVYDGHAWIFPLHLSSVQVCGAR